MSDEHLEGLLTCDLLVFTLLMGEGDQILLLAINISK